MYLACCFFVMVGRCRDGNSSQLGRQECEGLVVSCWLSGSEELSSSRASLYPSELACKPYILPNSPVSSPEQRHLTPIAEP